MATDPFKEGGRLRKFQIYGELCLSIQEGWSLIRHSKHRVWIEGDSRITLINKDGCFSEVRVILIINFISTRSRIRCVLLITIKGCN